MKKKYTEHSLIEKYKNLTSLIEYYKSLNLYDYRETNILAIADLEKFVEKDMYNRSFFCEKLLNLERELHELISRKDFNIDYVNNAIQEEKVLVEIIGSAEFDSNYSFFDCLIM